MMPTTSPWRTSNETSFKAQKSSVRGRWKIDFRRWETGDGRQDASNLRFPGLSRADQASYKFAGLNGFVAHCHRFRTQPRVVVFDHVKKRTNLGRSRVTSRAAFQLSRS